MTAEEQLGAILSELREINRKLDRPQPHMTRKAKAKAVGVAPSTLWRREQRERLRRMVSTL